MLTVYEALPQEAEQRAKAAQKLSQSLIKDLEWADAVAIGPAIGREEEARILLKTLLEGILDTEECHNKRRKALRGIVIDADALRLIASEPEFDELMRHRKKETACILTPHLAEFADLAHITVKEAAADRTGLLRELCGRYGCTVIGKDARTLVASAGLRQISMITKGNSGMATAGSGDVLTGITAAMLFSVSPGEDLGYRAAQAAAFIHAEAGDAARDSLGEHSMVAGDLIRAERGVFRLLTE